MAGLQPVFLERSCCRHRCFTSRRAWPAKVLRNTLLLRKRGCLNAQPRSRSDNSRSRRRLDRFDEKERDLIWQLELGISSLEVSDSQQQISVLSKGVAIPSGPVESAAPKSSSNQGFGNVGQLSDDDLVATTELLYAETDWRADIQDGPAGYDSDASQAQDSDLQFSEDNPDSAHETSEWHSVGAGGAPGLEALLADPDAELTAERISRIFPFRLDKFQERSLKILLSGRSVIVCAPTGAGKTAISEAATVFMLARGKKVIYTTPLKALSNQKLMEKRQLFGNVRCGLQTGDIKLNTDADIVVMTTEILRNIMYRTAELASAAEESSREKRLEDVGLIVLDEVHYLGDAMRGSVWEEIVINCPRHIQLLCMSATVQNPEDLGGWISQEHGPCVTVKTSKRPVPLDWMFCYRSAAEGVRLEPLLDGSNKQLNSKLSREAMLVREARTLLEKGQAESGQNSNSMDDTELLKSMLRLGKGLQAKVISSCSPPMEAVIAQLQDKELLPAIWFIMSRRDCDQSCLRMVSQGVRLTTPEEVEVIKSEIAALRSEQPDAVRVKFQDALCAGMAAHHAGCLPGWKGLVERLFQRGVLKLVFATGTLAAGINMPARSTVISSLSRRGDTGFVTLPHNELLQMAGRAGRRGYDTRGHCIVLQNRFDGAEEAWHIIQKGPEPLLSQFTASYGMVLNLLSSYSLEEARSFMNRSFSTYMTLAGRAEKEKQIKELEQQARALMDSAKSSTPVKEITRKAKKLRQEIQSLEKHLREARCQAAEIVIAQEGLPRVVVLLTPGKGEEGRGGLMPVFLMADIPREEGSFSSQQGKRSYHALAPDNRVLRVTVDHLHGIVRGPDGAVAEADMNLVLKHAQGVKPSGWQNYAGGCSSFQVVAGSVSTALVAVKLSSIQAMWDAILGDMELEEQLLSRQKALRSLVRQLEGDSRGNSRRNGANGSEPLDVLIRVRRLQQQARLLQEEIGEEADTTWRTFLECMTVLNLAGALILEPDIKVTPLGQVAQGVQAQNVLWFAMVLSHPALLDVTGPQLAAVLGALVSGEVLRVPDSGFTGGAAVSEKVVSILDELEEERLHLFDWQAELGLHKLNETLLVDLRLAGVVEAWASGATWKELMTDETLDDGDLARLLVRTIDMLRQVTFLEKLLPWLKAPALAASRAMDRSPIADMAL